MNTLNFRLNSETEIPQDIIADAPTCGPFDDYADYLVETLDIEVSETDARAYLKTLGAWDAEELQDHKANVKRLLWIAILDCKENETTYWYMGA